ncbi:MAG: hypothetical protein ISS63_11970 [Desulfobacteraceae bacterium]|nr:hypothetical protein [Desulfobacteraceae bacterium]
MLEYNIVRLFNRQILKEIANSLLMNIPFPESLLPRKILHRIVPFLDPENIILLSGERQTGKTYLLYLIIRHLWKKGISPSDGLHCSYRTIQHN